MVDVRTPIHASCLYMSVIEGRHSARPEKLKEKVKIVLSRRLAATESITVQRVLMAPHPMGSPL